MLFRSRGQAGRSGILIGYTGGLTTEALFQQHPYSNTDVRDMGVNQDAKQFLSRVEAVYPGISALWNGRAAGSVAHRNPLWNLSYSYWRVGQCQTIAGYEGVPQGNVFFAGEHTSVDAQGYMEGAASSGVRVAGEVAAVARRW